MWAALCSLGSSSDHHRLIPISSQYRSKNAVKYSIWLLGLNWPSFQEPAPIRLLSSIARYWSSIQALILKALTAFEHEVGAWSVWARSSYVLNACAASELRDLSPKASYMPLQNPSHSHAGSNACHKMITRCFQTVEASRVKIESNLYQIYSVPNHHLIIPNG